MGYTMGHAVFRNPYHINIIRVQLTRNLVSIFPEIHEEVVASFSDLISAVDDGMFCTLHLFAIINNELRPNRRLGRTTWF